MGGNQPLGCEQCVMTLLTVEHPDWMHDAECTRANPELFYPEPAGRSVDQAKAVCARCTVTDQCLAFALEHGEIDYGVWGGLTVKERRQLVPSRGRGYRRNPARCGTVSGYAKHRRLGEQACYSCLDAIAAAQRRRTATSRSLTDDRETVVA
jgi:WhiB family redox-sensing transcriptional regulator